MHSIYSDIEKNRLYLSLGTICSKREVGEIENKILKEVKQLKQGFTCISNLNNFCMGKDLKDNFMQKIQEILWDSGIKAVARISPIKQEKGHFLFEQGSAIWPGYRIIPVNNLKEAEASLDLLTAKK